MALDERNIGRLGATNGHVASFVGRLISAYG
jgi:hypothetical protein